MEKKRIKSLQITQKIANIIIKTIKKKTKIIILTPKRKKTIEKIIRKNQKKLYI